MLNATVKPRFLRLWFQQKAADVLSLEECGWFVCCLVVKNLCKASTEVAAREDQLTLKSRLTERRPVETDQTRGDQLKFETDQTETEREPS